MLESFKTVRESVSEKRQSNIPKILTVDLYSAFFLTFCKKKLKRFCQCGPANMRGVDLRSAVRQPCIQFCCSTTCW